MDASTATRSFSLLLPARLKNIHAQVLQAVSESTSNAEGQQAAAEWS
jgi:hypothetical protein